MISSLPTAPSTTLPLVLCRDGQALVPALGIQPKVTPLCLLAEGQIWGTCVLTLSGVASPRTVGPGRDLLPVAGPPLLPCCQPALGRRGPQHYCSVLVTATHPWPRCPPRSTRPLL